MSIKADFNLCISEDATLTIEMAPPTPIGAWAIHFQCTVRPGGTSGLIDAYVASGYNGASGITILNSGAGIFNVFIPGASTSGFDEGDYYYQARRTTSGQNTVLSEGYMVLSY